MTKDPFLTPDPKTAASSRIMDFARHAGLDGSDYTTLHRWSVTDLEGFWGAVWEYFGIDADRRTSGSWPRRPCRAPAGSPVPPSTTPTTPCATSGTRAWRSSPSTRRAPGTR